MKRSILLSAAVVLALLAAIAVSALRGAEPAGGERPLGAPGPGEEARLASELATPSMDGGVRRSDTLAVEAREPGGESQRSVATHDAPLSGRVTTPDGAPLAGARVTRRSRRLGKALEETRTDEEGRYRFDQTTDSPYVTPVLDGYVLLRHARSRKDGRITVDVVMARAGRLAITFTGREGERLEGCRVWLHAVPSWVERKTSTAHDEGTGRIVFEDVWSDVPLRLAIDLGDSNFDTRLMWQGEIVRDADATRGIPIVVRPDETLELAVELPGSLRIEGIIRQPDGTPVPRAWVAVTDLERPASERERVLVGEANAVGRFTLLLPDGDSLGRLRVDGGERKRGGWGTLQHVIEGGTAEVHARDAVDGELPVEVVVAPTFPIRGRVLGPDGQRLRSMVSAVPAGAPGPHVPASYGLRVSRMAHHTDRDEPDGKLKGQFELPGLPPGLYDVYASFDQPKLTSRFPLGLVVARGVEAGTDDLVLRVPPERGVHVRVRVRKSPGARFDPQSGATLVYGRVLGEPSTELAVPLPTEAITDPTLWPRGMPGKATGMFQGDTELGFTHCVYVRMRHATLRIPPMERGWYVFGVLPSGTGKSPAPVSTGLVYLDDGEHSLDFVAGDTGAIAGRVQALTEGERLAVAVAGGDGRELTVRRAGTTEMHRVHDVNADGTFLLDFVPTGRLRLRIGTRPELERGTARREVNVTVEAGQFARVREEGL